MSKAIRVPTWLAGILVTTFIGGMISLQVYTVQKITALEVRVAELAARIDAHIANDNQVASK